jgi:membrane associated rhomboid family serine protease
LIPIRDVNPSLRRPWLTWGIIVLATYIFFFVQPQTGGEVEEFAYRFAAIPCELTTGNPLDAGEIRGGGCSEGGQPVFPDKLVLGSVLTSMFLHGHLLHLFGNMLSLWIFGNNIEDAYGRLGYALLYLASGAVATVGYVLLRPESTIPLVGASGAIAGIMGSYLVLFPRASVLAVIPIFLLPWFVAVRAWVFLLIWFAGQFLLAGAETGIAWEAHVAGFLFGMLATLVLSPSLRRRLRSHRRQVLRTW